MLDLTFTLASQSDQCIILDILQETQLWLRTKGINQWTLPFTLQWVNECLEKKVFFVGSTENEIVAVFRLVKSDPCIWEENIKDSLYIHSVAVRLSWKGHQIGREIFKWIEKYAIQKGYNFLRLDCLADNLALCKYYENTGFIHCATKEIINRESVYYAQLFEKTI